MKTVSIIRGRGQLTIPDSIRKIITWMRPMSAVTISIIKPDELVIKPHQENVDWDKIWKGIRKARSIHGKSKQSAVEFLHKDRSSH